MKFLVFFAPFIKNIDKPVCKDCKYYLFSKECGKFSETDVVSGKKTYEYAKSVRNDITKCGLEAKYFEESNFKDVKEAYYCIKDYIWLLSVLMLYLLEIYASINVHKK